MMFIPHSYKVLLHIFYSWFRGPSIYSYYWNEDYDLKDNKIRLREGVKGYQSIWWRENTEFIE